MNPGDLITSPIDYPQCKGQWLELLIMINSDLMITLKAIMQLLLYWDILDMIWKMV